MQHNALLHQQAGQLGGYCAPAVSVGSVAEGRAILPHGGTRLDSPGGPDICSSLQPGPGGQWGGPILGSLLPGSGGGGTRSGAGQGVGSLRGASRSLNGFSQPAAGARASLAGPSQPGSTGGGGGGGCGNLSAPQLRSVGCQVEKGLPRRHSGVSSQVGAALSLPAPLLMPCCCELWRSASR